MESILQYHPAHPPLPPIGDLRERVLVLQCQFRRGARALESQWQLQSQLRLQLQP
jgi:hypothetical protein